MLLVDAANVIGSRPTGWWRDRAKAAGGLVERLRHATAASTLPPPVVVVLEGAGRQGAEEGSADGVEVVHAEGRGDDTIVAVAAAASTVESAPVVLVSADRALGDRCRALGADVVGPSWLLDRLAAAGDHEGRVPRSSELREQLRVAAPADRVWTALTVAEQRRRWWPYLDLDATVGGRFEERWTDDAGAAKVTSGTVLDTVPNRLLRMTWADEDWGNETEVTLHVEPVGPGATLVTVLHRGWSGLPGGDELLEAHRTGWRMHLEHLRRAAERSKG